MAEAASSAKSSWCTACGTPLPPSRLEGLCPICLLEETHLPEAGREAASEGGTPLGPGLMQLPGYRLIREIARGGMGIVYEARQISPARGVAIKMLLPHLMEEPSMRERFRREAQSMAGLDHPGILPVYEVGDHNGLPFFSMKLASGGTLSSLSWRFRSQWRLLAELMAALADAIHHAHLHGVLHRDLKPANILFDDQGRCYLSDFGIAKQLAGPPADFDLTKSATLLGTPNYLPPEWAAGTAKSPTTSADLYGLGAIFYQLLTGDPPHRAGQLTTLLRQIADDPVIPPRQVDRAIPQDLEIICLKSLAKDPADRYGSAHDMAGDFQLWLAGRPIRARPASVMERTLRWSKRNPLPATLAALLLLALTGGGAALWSALQTSRRNLHDSLISQASALRETGVLGNRTRAIRALEDAISLRASPESREELTSALALTDLKELRRFSHGAGSRVHTNAGVTAYVSSDPKGHVSVRRISDGALISELPGEIIDPDGYGPLSPDGRFVCLRPVRGEPFFVWDCKDHVFRQKNVPGAYMLFAPDGRTLVIGDNDGQLTSMDVLSGAVLSRYPTDLRPIRPYSFSPDGTMVVTGQFKASKFLVIETATGKVIKRGEHPKAANVRCAAWRPDGSGFFVGTESFKIFEWSLAENSLPRQYTGHSGNILALAAHQEGEWLLSQSEDGTTRLWNTASAQTVAQLPYTGVEVRFFPDGRQFICEDRANKELHIGQLVPSPVCRQLAIPHPDPDNIGSRGSWFVTFSPDGGLLSAADIQGLFHYDGHTGQLLNHAPLGYCWSLAWAQDHSALFSVSNQGLQRWRTSPHPGPEPGWQLQTAEVLATEIELEGQGTDGQNHVALSGDLKTLALAYDSFVALYDARTGARTSSLPPTGFRLDAVALNESGSLAAASLKGSQGVPVWHTGEQKLLQTLPAHSAEATVRFHPGTNHLYTGDLTALTRWDATTGTMIWRRASAIRPTLHIQTALSADGQLLAASLDAESVHFLDPETGNLITRLRHPTPRRVSGLAFSPDQSRLAVLCVGHLVQLWDLGQLRAELRQRGVDWAHPPLPAPGASAKWTFAPAP